MKKIGDILRHSKYQALLDQRKKDREKAENMLREDSEALASFKGVILEYEADLLRIKERRKQFLESDRYSSSLGDFSPYYRQRIFDEVLEGKWIPIMERGLRNMKHVLRTTQKNHKVNIVWQRKFDHATREVFIGDVVRHFLYVPHGFQGLLRCPFHEDATASLKIYEKGNNYHCFGCGAHGMPVDFVMKIKNCTFKEAVEFLYHF